MRTWRSESKITLEPGAYLGLALIVLILPLRWVAAALLAGLLHELCHGLAIRLCGGRVWAVRVGAGGAVMETEPMSWGRELICALAGPLGGLALLLLARWFPRLAICAGLQSIYNLLPVYPLDGGRALRCGAKRFLPRRAGERFCRLTEAGCLAAVGLLGAYGTFWLHLGLLPLLLAAALLMKVCTRKTPCKQAQERVQ